MKLATKIIHIDILITIIKYAYVIQAIIVSKVKKYANVMIN